LHTVCFIRFVIWHQFRKGSLNCRIVRPHLLDDELKDGVSKRCDLVRKDVFRSNVTMLDCVNNRPTQLLIIGGDGAHRKEPLHGCAS